MKIIQLNQIKILNILDIFNMEKCEFNPDKFFHKWVKSLNLPIISEQGILPEIHLGPYSKKLESQLNLWPSQGQVKIISIVNTCI